MPNQLGGDVNNSDLHAKYYYLLLETLKMHTIIIWDNLINLDILLPLKHTLTDIVGNGKQVKSFHFWVSIKSKLLFITKSKSS